MQALFQELSSALSAGNPALLVTILSSEGSTPRGAGALMAVFPDGHSCGTIGGGAVELAAQQLAADLLERRQGDLRRFCFLPEDAAGLGMVCGGTVTVQFRYLPANDQHTLILLQHLLSAISDGRSIWLLLDTDGNRPLQLAASDSACHGGSSQTLPPALLQQKPVIRDHWLSIPVVQPGRVYLFGGGHVSQALVPVLASVGFQTVVYDDRPEFSDSQRFPQAVLTVCDSFSNLHAHLSLTPEDYLVIVTRGHQADYQVLEQVLRSGARYIGCIGSRRKLALCRDRLLKAGFSDEEYAQVYAPIGLKIGSETPEEIAISIAAELIAVRAGLNPRTLPQAGSLSAT